MLCHEGARRRRCILSSKALLYDPHAWCREICPSDEAEERVASKRDICEYPQLVTIDS